MWFLFLNVALGNFKSEVKMMAGRKLRGGHLQTSEPHHYVEHEGLPDEWNWGDVDGLSYLTPNLNQHIPQYCGSCWAHASVSSLADRIKIQRMKQKKPGPDIQLSVQFLLNCGTEIAGSCEGGDDGGAYEFIHGSEGIPFLTCQPYLACSSDSPEGFCPQIRDYTQCSAINLCATCDISDEDNHTFCNPLGYYPNATVSEFGPVTTYQKMKAEIFARGPISCSLNSVPIENYVGGIVDRPNDSHETDHVVSIVGWGTSDGHGQYWIVRNSWGEYWGERGFFRVKMGENQLGLEEECNWAVPGSWTEINMPCYEDGTNCDHRIQTTHGWDESTYRNEAASRMHRLCTPGSPECDAQNGGRHGGRNHHHRTHHHGH